MAKVGASLHQLLLTPHPHVALLEHSWVQSLISGGGEMVQWLRTLADLVEGIHIEWFTTTYKVSYKGSNTFLWPSWAT